MIASALPAGSAYKETHIDFSPPLFAQ